MYRADHLDDLDLAVEYPRPLRARTWALAALLGLAGWGLIGLGLAAIL